MPKWNSPIPLREGKLGRPLLSAAIAGAIERLGIRNSALRGTADACRTRVERAHSRRRPRSIRLGGTLAREEAGCLARTAANRVQRTPLTIRASFLATKTSSPMAAASVAKRKAVRARSGGPGGGRAWSLYAGDSRVSVSGRPMGAKPIPRSSADTGTRGTSIGFQSPKRSPATANAPSSSPTVVQPTRRILRMLASGVYPDFGA
jgi:hypothetical protein